MPVGALIDLAFEEIYALLLEQASNEANSEQNKKHRPQLGGRSTPRQGS
jgi:hypothetical protein